MDIVYDSEKQIDNVYGIPNEMQWTKIDHCAFPLGPNEPKSLFKGQVSSILTNCQAIVSDPSECMATCTRDGVCRTSGSGIVVAPLYNPPQVAEEFKDISAIPWDTNRTIQYGTAECPRQPFLDDPSLDQSTYICATLMPRGPGETFDPYVIVNDPRDPFFYSTCYVREMTYNFTALPAQPSEQAVEWRQHDHCLSCAERVVNEDSGRWPLWTTATRDNCVNCDLEAANLKREDVAFEVLPTITATQLEAKTNCAGYIMNGTRVGPTLDESIFKYGFPLGILPTTNYGGQLFRYPQDGPKEHIVALAHLLMARDPECSDTFLRQEDQSFLAFACLRKGKTCAKESHNRMSLWKFDEEKTALEKKFKNHRQYQ